MLNPDARFILALAAALLLAVFASRQHDRISELEVEAAARQAELAEALVAARDARLECWIGP